MEAQLLHKVSELLDTLEQTTGEPGDLSSMLQHIAHTTKTFFAADASVIFAINPLTSQFIGSLTVVGNLLKRDNLSYQQPKAEGVAPQVLSRGILLVPDLEATPEYQSKFTRTEDMRSFAGLALRARYTQKPLGVLYLDFRLPQQFSPDDQEIFQLFAEQASYMLQETWLLRRYQEVARIGQEINQELATVDTLFEKLQQRVASMLDTSHALLLAVYQQQTNILDLYMQDEGRSIRRDNVPLAGAYQYVIETQQLLFIREMSKDVEFLPFQRAQTITEIGAKESLIFVPLVLRDLTLGVLSIQHTQPNTYNQEDLFILQVLANHIVLALHNIRLFSGLNQLNETGQLLTQQLESEQTLQATVDKIQTATKADLVVLYPYEAMRQRFVFPPKIAGKLLDSTIESMHLSRSDDIASLMLRRLKPIFARKSATMYSRLHGNVHIRQGSFGQREQIHSTAAVPLWVGNEVVGVLFVNFRQPQHFDATQQLFIEGLAHYAAIAIKNAQAFGELSRRRVRELEILQHIDRELSRTLDLESLLNTLLKLAYEQVPADEASILLYNPRIQALEIPAAISPHAEARRAHIISLQDTKGITRWVLENKKSARVDNVHRDPQWRDLYIAASADTIAELDVPLIDGEEVIGVLNFESTREAVFNGQDEDFLSTLAGQAVLAIKNAQAYEREKRLAEEGRVLNEISKQIISQLDPIHVFHFILEKALELTYSTLGSLHLYNPDQNDLRMVADRGVAEDKKGKRQGLHEGIVGDVARNKRLLNVANVSQPPWDKIYLEFFPGVRSELAVPMLAGNELRGVLNVESPNPNNFSEGDERLLKGLADLAVVALQNAERYEKAEKEAQRFELLYKAGQELGKITESAQLGQAHATVVQIAEEHTQSLVVIRRYDDDTQELVVVQASQPEYAQLYSRQKLDAGVNGQVARERRTIVIHDTHNLPPGVVAPQPLDLTTRSLLITPIMFKERYYGSLGLSNKDVGYFQNADIRLLEGLAHQLASTIYRLETVQARQEAEEMSSIGQIAFALTHRLDNALGLVETYVNDIRRELAAKDITNGIVSGKLENIKRAARTVLDLSEALKAALTKSGEAMAGESVVTVPRALFEKALAQTTPSLPLTIQICVEIGDDVAKVRAIPGLVLDILDNLLANAIQAMPQGANQPGSTPLP